MSGSGLSMIPATIMNADILAYCQKEGQLQISFYLLAFFYYLYGMIYVWWAQNSAEELVQLSACKKPTWRRILSSKDPVSK